MNIKEIQFREGRMKNKNDKVMKNVEEVEKLKHLSNWENDRHLIFEEVSLRILNWKQVWAFRSKVNSDLLVTCIHRHNILTL